MSFTTTSERQRRRSAVLLGLLLVGSVLLLVGIAVLAVYLVTGDTAATTPAPDSSLPTTAGPSPTPDARTVMADGPVQLVAPAERTLGVGIGWPSGEAGAVSAAANYATVSTIDLGLLERRLAAIYADSEDTESEIAQIIEDAQRGRANLGVPLAEPVGQAAVRLDAQAVTYRVRGSDEVAGYVLVQRRLTTYTGDPVPADVLPVPFVVRRLDDDWKLTANPVNWTPPPVAPSGRPAEGGWRELLPPR